MRYIFFSYPGVILHKSRVDVSAGGETGGLAVGHAVFAG